MATRTLKDRIDSYQAHSCHLLLPRLPTVLSVNGVGFSKLTNLLEKPEDLKLTKIFHSLALRLCSEIEGVVFAFHHNDEICLLLKSDQNFDTVPWMGGNIQKIVSFASSLATDHFGEWSQSLELNMGRGKFVGNVFQVPDLSEAENVFVFKQQGNFFMSLQFACFYGLLEKGFEKESAKKMLMGLRQDEKVELLREECGIDFADFSPTFRKGCGFYRGSRFDERGLMRNQWIVDSDLPIFTEEVGFLEEIFRNRK